VYKGKNLDPISQTVTDILAKTRHLIPDRAMETSETVSDIEPVGSIFFGPGPDLLNILGPGPGPGPGRWSTRRALVRYTVETKVYCRISMEHQ